MKTLFALCLSIIVAHGAVFSSGPLAGVTTTNNPPGTIRIIIAAPDNTWTWAVTTTNLASLLTNTPALSNILSRVGTVETQTNNQGARLTSLESQTNTLGSRATAIEAQTNNLGARVTSIESQTNTHGSRLTSLESQTNTLGSRVTTVESQTSSLNSQTNSLGSRVTTVEDKNSTALSLVTSNVLGAGVIVPTMNALYTNVSQRAFIYAGAQLFGNAGDTVKLKIMVATNFSVGFFECGNVGLGLNAAVAGWTTNEVNLFCHLGPSDIFYFTNITTGTGTANMSRTRITAE